MTSDGITGAGGATNWIGMSGDERAAAVDAAIDGAAAAPPDSVEALKAHLAATGWPGLDNLVAVADGAPSPTVLEWCGLAIAAVPATPEGAARYDDFCRALAQVVLPGMKNTRSAVACMKRASHIWQRRVDDSAVVAGMSTDVGARLREPEPAEDPWSLSDVAEHLAAHYEDWVAAPPWVITTMTLWSLGTWGVPQGDDEATSGVGFYPYLWFTSVDADSGKSTALQSLRAGVRRSYSSLKTSPSALFRTIAIYQPTLLMDEIGRFVVGNRELEGLLEGACYRWGTVTISEKVAAGTRGGEKWVPKSYACFGPIALSGLGTLEHTLQSRSIRVRMLPAPRSHKKLRPSEHRRAVNALKAHLGPHLAAHADTIADAMDNGPRLGLPESLSNRAADVWDPLLAVADLCGGTWRLDCLDAIERLHVPPSIDVTPVRDALDALHAYQDFRIARRVGQRLDVHDQFANAGVQSIDVQGPFIPLDVVPVSGFRSWLRDDGGAFMIATASPLNGPSSESRIYRLLAQAEIYPQRFTKKEGKLRADLMVLRLKDLERAWGEQRGQ